MLGIVIEIDKDTDLPDHIMDTVQEDPIEELNITLDRSNDGGSVSGNSGTEDTLDTPIDLTKNDDDPQGFFLF